MPLWKNHHFVFQHLIFNSKDHVKSEENTEAYTKPQHTHEKQNEVRHTDMREHFPVCMLRCCVFCFMTGVDL